MIVCDGESWENHGGSDSLGQQGLIVTGALMDSLGPFKLIRQQPVYFEIVNQRTEFLK